MILTYEPQEHSLIANTIPVAFLIFGEGEKL